MGIPNGTRVRLLEHYGQPIKPWLAKIEATMRTFAQQWSLSVDGFHDAGWTSVVMVCRDSTSRVVVMKALPETSRFHQELQALRHWRQAPVCQLLRADPGEQVLLLEAVADLPGGAGRPSDHVARVAGALSTLHRNEAAAKGAVPLLSEYYRETVVPRVERGAARFVDAIDGITVRVALELCDRLSTASTDPMMLHSDLYAENVLFDADGWPVFIDPHAKIGSPAFDWAFWCVYYQHGGHSDRFRLCRNHAPSLYDEVLEWSITLAVDGALYYLANGDVTGLSSMRAVLAADELVPLITGQG